MEFRLPQDKMAEEWSEPLVVTHVKEVWRCGGSEGRKDSQNKEVEIFKCYASRLSLRIASQHRARQCAELLALAMSVGKCCMESN